MLMPHARLYRQYNPELSLSREGDMLSAGAHTQAIYKECNMSRALTPPVPVFPRALAFSAGRPQS
jgi:hypothetical protein